MGDVIVTEFVSLDGVMEAPGGEPTHPHSGWTMDFMSSEQMEYKLEEVQDADAMLLGRTTYEGFAAAWPGRDDPQGFAAKMNAMPKYVVSGSLTDPEWENTTVVGTDLPSAVADIKARHDGPILVAGSATLVHGLTDAGLVDEYRLMVFPVLLGTGKRVFADAERAEKGGLTLEESTAFSSGVVAQHFRPVAAADGEAG